MIAIRGATTVEIDSEEEITICTIEMIEQIMKLNKLSEDDLTFLLFSHTADLKSFYSARSIREWGLKSTPLFSSLEPEICGALKKCIRVLALCDKTICKKDVKHVYLRKAVNLRSSTDKKQI